MLIASPRHTAADLRLWAELEAADLAYAQLPILGRRVAEAKAAIAAFTSAGPCYAGVSWGKDSVVLAYLLWSVARDVSLMHLRPTNHNPDCDLVRDDFFARFPGQSYQEIDVDYSAVDRDQPDAIQDRDTDRLWYAAIRKWEDCYDGRHLTGIRADESPGRFLRQCRWGLTSPRACAPLSRWTISDVFAYLTRYFLPVHSVYAMLGGGRWDRRWLRVAEIGDTHGKGHGRREWEIEYYGDVLRRLDAEQAAP
jgi:phosphoadenosine phosphosulfate reductase